MTAGQYLTHAHSHITQAVAAMDGCFTLIGAHQQGKAIRSMNRENPRLKDPLLPRRVQSTPLSASSTQHMWELLTGNRTAVLQRNAPGRRIMGLCMCAPCFKFVFWKQWTKLFYCIKDMKSPLYIVNFLRYWSLCFCPKLCTCHFVKNLVSYNQTYTMGE